MGFVTPIEAVAGDFVTVDGDVVNDVTVSATQLVRSAVGFDLTLSTAFRQYRVDRPRSTGCAVRLRVA